MTAGNVAIAGLSAVIDRATVVQSLPLLLGWSFLFFFLALLDDLGFGSRCGRFALCSRSGGGCRSRFFLLHRDDMDDDLVGRLQHLDLCGYWNVRNAQGLVNSEIRHVYGDPFRNVPG